LGEWDGTMNETPKFVYACPRDSVRHRLRHGRGLIKFDSADEQHYRLSIVDISPHGLCFELDDGQSAFPVGSTIHRAVILIEGTEISASVTIAHVTKGFSTGTLCGAKIEPATPSDEQKLVTLIKNLIESASDSPMTAIG
jgi:hypothetical protein